MKMKVSKQQLNHIKDSNYYKKEMSSSFRNLVNTPPAAIEAEVLAGSAVC